MSKDDFPEGNFIADMVKHAAESSLKKIIIELLIQSYTDRFGHPPHITAFCKLETNNCEEFIIQPNMSDIEGPEEIRHLQAEPLRVRIDFVSKDYVGDFLAKSLGDVLA